MVLTVHDIGVARAGMPVLEGVSFRLEAGQALILRGPNGVGKTTLLRAIAGLQPVLAGEIICATDAVAYAAHSDGIKPTLSVSENLNFWAHIFGTQGIETALESYQLTPLRDRAAGALSAGQKRRLGLARMLVTGRPIWVMDEPTVSLDANAVGWFADAVRAHLGGGGAALIATHIDLGLSAEHLDLSGYRARSRLGAEDEAFL